MANLEKQLKKFSPKERERLIVLIERIVQKDFRGIDLKKLKGLRNFFRVRKGNFRIIFILEDGKDPNIISIDRRKEDTYKL